MRVEVRDEHSGGSSDVVLFGAVDLQTSFPAMFACRYPVQLARTGGSTSPALAIAVSAAGGLGVLSGTCSAQVLRAPLDEIPPDLSVGVNFLVRFLDRVSLEHAAARAEDTARGTAVVDPGLADER